MASQLESLARRPLNLKTDAVKRSLRGDRLFVQVVNGLAREIIRAGSEHIVFPAEPQLSRMLGVSRTVLREAVKVLEAKGLVEVGHGQGVKSRPRAHWNHLDPDVLNWLCESGADEMLLRNMSEAREILEPAAAALAAARGDQTAIARINAWYKQMEEQAHDPEAYIQADLALHNEIFAACGNDILNRIVQGIHTALRTVRDVSIQVPGGWAKDLPLHSALVDAITRRDPEAARAATVVIIRSAATDIQTVLQSRSQAPSLAVG
jgi:GntR family galactonate operon transcriptional repressor